MIVHDIWNLEVDFSPERRIEIEPVQEHLCTDTGLLLFRQLDGQLGFNPGSSRSIGRHPNRSNAFSFGNGA